MFLVSYVVFTFSNAFCSCLQLELDNFQKLFKKIDKSSMNCFGSFVELFGVGILAANKKI
jgi:hypothetical protein